MNSRWSCGGWGTGRYPADHDERKMSGSERLRHRARGVGGCSKRLRHDVIEHSGVEANPMAMHGVCGNARTRTEGVR